MNKWVRVRITLVRRLCAIFAFFIGVLVAGPVSANAMYEGWTVDDIELTGYPLEDFENGTGFWNPSGNWSRKTNGAHSGDYLVQATYAFEIGDSLTSDLLTPLSTTANTFTFWHKFDIRLNLDYAYVEILDGTNWSLLASYTGNQNAYQQVTLPISSTGNYRLRFRLETGPAVPEPTTLALMGLGLAGIGYQRHRSKKAA